MTTKKEAQIDVNAEAFEKTMAAFDPAYYGTFTKPEKHYAAVFRLEHRGASVRPQG